MKIRNWTYARGLWHALQARKIKTVGVMKSHGILCTENDRRIRSYKDSHCGQRCFLIGNGGSLNERDLDKIVEESSFACNLIYKIFPRTIWRPSFYCISDPEMILSYSQEITDHIHSPIFTNHLQMENWRGSPHDLMILNALVHGDYKVSRDMSGYYMPSKATIMTMMMELAMYMGFQTIYLLGVDGTNSFSKNAHFTEQYFTGEYIQKRIKGSEFDKTNIGNYYVSLAESAYRQIQAYAYEKNIAIINVSRIRGLCVFPYQNFDEIPGL